MRCSAAAAKSECHAAHGQLTWVSRRAHCWQLEGYCERFDLTHTYDIATSTVAAPVAPEPDVRAPSATERKLIPPSASWEAAFSEGREAVARLESRLLSGIAAGGKGMKKIGGSFTMASLTPLREAAAGLPKPPVLKAASSSSLPSSTGTDALPSLREVSEK